MRNSAHDRAEHRAQDGKLEFALVQGKNWHILLYLPVWVEPDHAMQTMNISLPEIFKSFVDGQVAQGRYSSANEYVRELIRAQEETQGRRGT